MLVTTPSADNANSYATIAEADEYHTTVSAAQEEVWTALDDTDKERYLKWATRQIDANWTFAGTRTVEDQALEWPRTGAPRDGRYSTSTRYLPSNSIPKFVICAVSELARIASERGTESTEAADVSGIKEISSGGSKIVFAEGAVVAAPEMFPESVLSLLRKHAGLLSDKSGGFGAVSLVRS